MPAPTTLPSHPERAQIEDVEALWRETRSWLQRWCQATWTDFNDSDPGVTIAQELCYALTDLALRAALPVSTLLGRLDDDTRDTGHTLFPPDQILPMEPLTPDDYASQILDRFPEVLHAQFDPLTDGGPAGVKGVPGRYGVRLIMDPDLGDPELHFKRSQDIRRFLQNHRNLGERFDAIECVPMTRFSIHGVFHLAAGGSPEPVLCDAYLAVRNALVPPVRRCTREELEAHGRTWSDILTGPLLQHGWVEPSSASWILSWSEVERRTLEALRTIPGLADVDIAFSAPKAVSDGVPWCLTSHFRLGIGAPDPQWNCLHLEPVPSGYTLDGKSLTNRILAGVASLHRATVPAAANLTRHAAVPAASSAHDVQTFEPISNGLPAIYGLGPHGLLDQSGSSRRTQARQLLGYLLPFEQLAANLAAQLAHIRDLLSHQPQTTTEFCQHLYNLPGVLPLLRGFPDETEPLTQDQQRVQEENFRRDNNNPYWRGLRDIVHDSKRFLRRRHQFLDHLLARFGESYPLSNLTSRESIANKEVILQELPRLGRRRAAARPLSSASDPTEAESGLERRLSILLRRDDGSQETPRDSEQYESTDDRRIAPPSSHFLVEHLLFLPDAAPALSVAADSVTFPLDLFAHRITHVLLNWTAMPLRPAFQQDMEQRIRSACGAHLESRFLWFERAEFESTHVPFSTEPTYRQVRTLHDAWLRDGMVPLRLVRPPEDGQITVRKDDSAARLFVALHDPSNLGRIGRES